MTSPLLLALFALQSASTAEAQSLAECVGLPDRERLACYDRVTEGMQPAGPALPQAAEAQTIIKPVPGEVPATDIVTSAPPPPAVAMKPGDRQLADPGADEDAGRQDLPQNQSRFGLRKKDADDDGRYSADVASVRFTPRGQAVVTLVDGQVWRQLSSDSRKLRRRDILDASSAEIERGALGSYRLKLDTSGRSIKVSRDE